MLLRYLIWRWKRKMKIISPTGLGVRNDAAGHGYYGAKRGTRLHMGMDFLCKYAQDVVSPIDGFVERIAYPYAGDRDYKGLVIRGSQLTIKLFYVAPWDWIIGTEIKQGDVVGMAQDISAKYGGKMLPHVHLSIVAIDPEILL
jgi:hypothetical protein